MGKKAVLVPVIVLRCLCDFLAMHKKKIFFGQNVYLWQVFYYNTCTTVRKKTTGHLHPMLSIGIH